MSVNAVFFKGDVIGSDVAFFENVDVYVAFYGGLVNGAAIAIQEDGFYPLLLRKGLKKGGPVFHAAAVPVCAKRIEEQVAAAEIYLVDFCPGGTQVACQAAEEVAHRALQKKDIFSAEVFERILHHLNMLAS